MKKLNEKKEEINTFSGDIEANQDESPRGFIGRMVLISLTRNDPIRTVKSQEKIT